VGDRPGGGGTGGSDRVVGPGETPPAALSGSRGHGRRWLVCRADPLRAITSPVPIPLSAPNGRYVSADRRSHAELLDATGLSDVAVAGLLGVAVSRVSRWHAHACRHSPIRRPVRSAELGSTIIMVTHDPAVAAALGRTVTIRRKASSGGAPSL
jgi:hypothetical protein